MKHYVTALSIAGSDSSGGAGIQADIKTMSALGVYATTAITAITVQNTCGVSAIQPIESAIVEGQISAVMTDIPADAIKIGMLFSASIAETVSHALHRHNATNIVLDPVMVSTSGSRLLEQDAVDAIRTLLIPMADIVTPNAAEAQVITDGITDPKEQARAILAMGPKAVLIKGGDNPDEDYSIDYMAISGNNEIITLSADRVRTANTHGTGCSLSSAIASYLALGCNIESAVLHSKQYMSEALLAGSHITCGHGHGPINHFFDPKPLVSK